MNEKFADIITIGQFGFSIMASSFVFVTLFALIYKLPKQVEMSVSMPVRINIITWIFTAGLNVAYVSISIISRILPTINSDFVFWSGGLYFSATTSVSVSVFFLMMDRCFILLMPPQVDLSTKGRLCSANAILVIIQFFVYILVFVHFELPDNNETNCETFSCVTKNHAFTLNVTRCIFGIINSIMAAAFFFLILRYNKRRSHSIQAEASAMSGRQKSVANSVQPVSSFKVRGNVFAAIAVLSQIIFNFLPNLIAFIFLQGFNMTLSIWVGPAVSTLTQLDALLSTMVYLKIIGGRLSKQKQSDAELNRS